MHLAGRPKSLSQVEDDGGARSLHHRGDHALVALVDQEPPTASPTRSGRLPRDRPRRSLPTGQRRVLPTQRDRPLPHHRRPGAGETSRLPVTLPAGKGGDTPPFHSSDGFRVAVAGTSCQTGIYRAREGSEVTEFAGGDTFEYALRGDFFVHSETRCSITVTPA